MSVVSLLHALEAWRASGRAGGLATVVGMEASAPLQPGAAMAVSDQADIIGSLSGGCIEGAVLEALQEVMSTGRARLETYGISDEEAFSVGLSCGGTVHVLLEPLAWDAPWYTGLLAAVGGGAPFALAAVTGGAAVGRRLTITEEGTAGTTGDGEVDRGLAAQALRRIAEGTDEPQPSPGPPATFLEVHGPPPTIYIFGFVDFASALAHLGKFLGYRVIVADPRSAFLSRERFPEADEIVHGWPHELLAERRIWPKDAICVLSHDPKIDVPAVKAALGTKARYVCALGGRRTRERRHQLLLEEGLSEAELRRLAAPAGLDLGGRSAEETALSMAAELVAVQRGHAGGRLAVKGSGIHAPTR